MVICLKRNNTTCIVVDTKDDCIDEMPLKTVLRCGIPVKYIEDESVNYEYKPVNDEYYILYTVTEVRNWQYSVEFYIKHKETDEIIFYDVLQCPEYPDVTVEGNYSVVFHYHSMTYPVVGGKSLFHRFNFNEKMMYQSEHKDKGFETGFKE